MTKNCVPFERTDVPLLGFTVEFQEKTDDDWMFLQKIFLNHLNLSPNKSLKGSSKGVNEV